MGDKNLEYLGIIQVGEHIGTKQSRSTYPKELLEATNELLKRNKKDIFSKFDSCYKEWFDALGEGIDKCRRLLLENSLSVNVTKDSTLTFCYELLLIFINQVNRSPKITEQESTYNYRALWRMLDAVKMVTSCCKFIPGETRLQAINFELRRRGLSLSNFYNADGILLDKEFDLEISILETSGPFALKDIKRETTDHIKAAYGLLAMLHRVAYLYEYADADTFKKLRVYFVHAADTKIRVWSFGLVSEQLYVLERIGSAILPVDHIDSMQEFKDVTNMMWDLKTSIDLTHKQLEEIKKSHEANKHIIEGRLQGHENIKKLESLLAESADVKLSSRVSDAEDIYVFSSPLAPQSPQSPQ
ncbi:hypothetical protein MBANPS3_005113 [Mucor bainieri]